MRDKAYYQGLLLNMVEPLKPHYSKDCAHLELGAAAAGYGSQIAGPNVWNNRPTEVVWDF